MPSKESKLEPALQLTGRVVDDANILSPETEAKLVRELKHLEKTFGPQFVIATTKSLNGKPINEYSLSLAKAWGVGHKNRSDGVVLLVAPHEKEVRIEVGFGLEGSLNDPFCSKVIREDMIPFFREGKMEEGILSGAEKLIDKMERTPTIDTNDNNSSEGRIAA